MRVYEIAKEVGIPNKDLIAKIRALGLEVNNHMSSLDADDVARIRRSLEKEKASVTAPAQTKKLSTGTVLRRRSSGERTDGDDVVVKPAPAAPVISAPPPVIRRRVEAAPVAVEMHAGTPVPARERAEREREREPMVARAPATPPPVEAPKPPKVVHAEPVARRVVEPAPVEEHRPAEERRLPEERRAARERAVERAPEPSNDTASSDSAIEVPPPPAPVVREPARPVAQPAAAAAEAPAPSSRSRVIVAGPQVVARAHGSEPIVERARPIEVEPPPSTPLPPRVTSVRPNAATAASEHAHGESEHKRVEARPPATARSQFEMASSAARAHGRQAAGRRGRDQGADGRGQQRRRRRGAAGTDDARSVAARRRHRDRAAAAHQITERTPIGGRPPPGPQPVNPIRGRFAQQQQQRGRPGQGRPGGPNDMRRSRPRQEGQADTITTPAEHKRVIRIEDTIAIADLARSMGIKAPEV